MKRFVIALSCMSSLMGMSPAAVNFLKVPASQLPFNPFIPRNAWIIKECIQKKSVLDKALLPVASKVFSSLVRTALACRSKEYVPGMKVFRPISKASRENGSVSAYLKFLVIKKNFPIKKSLTEEFIRQNGALLNNRLPALALITTEAPDIFYECELEPELEDVFYECEPSSFCDKGLQAAPVVVENDAQTEPEVATVAIQTAEVVDTASQTGQEARREVMHVRHQDQAFCSPTKICVSSLFLMQLIVAWELFVGWANNHPEYFNTGPVCV